MHRLLLLTLALALPAQAADPRMAIKLSADEVGTVNGQMRAMLNGVGQIVAGVAANDMKDGNHALKQLGDIMVTCNTCHETFRLVAKR